MPGGRCHSQAVKQFTDRGRFAERVLHGVDSNGDPETVVIWIERKEGGVWAVGRAVNPDWRSSREPRPEDYVFEEAKEDQVRSVRLSELFSPGRHSLIADAENRIRKDCDEFTG